MAAKAAKKPARKKQAARKPAVKKPAAKKRAVKVSASRRPAAARKPAATKPPAAVPAKKPSHPPVVHWEVQALDPVRQQAFFADLFGWPVDANNPMSYGIVSAGSDKSIGGGIGGTMDTTSRVTFYVQVADINAALARAESLGAATLMPRADIGMVIMAQFRDPEGNVIGLIEG